MEDPRIEACKWLDKQFAKQSESDREYDRRIVFEFRVMLFVWILTFSITGMCLALRCIFGGFK